MSKRQRRGRKTSIEDIYQNKNFVPPKEKNLETIFEEPRQSKDGAPILTSVKKYRRYLHFDPTQGKIQKRKVKAKKCIKKSLTKARVTRSAPETFKCEDIMFKLDELEDSSTDSDITTKRACRNLNESAGKNMTASHSMDSCSSEIKIADTLKKMSSTLHDVAESESGAHTQDDVETPDLTKERNDANDQEINDENSSPPGSPSSCIIS